MHKYFLTSLSSKIKKDKQNGNKIIPFSDFYLEMSGSDEENIARI